MLHYLHLLLQVFFGTLCPCCCSNVLLLLVQVLVEHGSEVRLGDDLMVIEAMKMRNAIKADRDGYVDEMFVKQGQIVAADQPLLKFR